VSPLRPVLFTVAAASMMLGAFGVLAPMLSTALWLPATIVLACHPASPLVRAISSALLRDGK
jgi:hypothetical protein